MALQIKRMKEIATLVIAAGLAVAASQEYNGRHALFVKTSSAAGKKDTGSTGRVWPDYDRSAGKKAITLGNDQRISSNRLTSISALESPASCSGFGRRHDGPKYPRVDSGDLPTGRT